MYRDLDPENWPKGKRIDQHSLIAGVLKEGFSADPPLCGDEDKIDGLIEPLKMVHVLDADSSQAITIEEARKGRNLVIQGPPGTGKSQTIANLIANAVNDGKKVLFVAEKMAALDVVHRRLSNIGLQDMCLELHSHKANKKITLHELEKTLNLGRPLVETIDSLARDLANERDRLNRHCERMHTVISPSGLTPYTLIGEYEALRRMGVEPTEFSLTKAAEWTSQDVEERRNLLWELKERIEAIGPPMEHSWRGSRVSVVLPNDIAELRSQLVSINDGIKEIQRANSILSAKFGLSTELGPKTLIEFAETATTISAVPEFDLRIMRDEKWSTQWRLISDLILQGNRYSKCRVALEDRVVDAAWETDVAKARSDIAIYGSSLFRFLNSSYRAAIAILRGIVTAELPKKREARVELLDTLMEGQKARRKLTEHAAIGKAAFGSMWGGENSPWPKLAEITKWVTDVEETNPPPKWIEHVAEMNNVDDVGKASKILKALLPSTIEALTRIFARIDLDLKTAFGCERVDDVAIDILAERVQSWIDDSESLTKWISFRRAWIKSTELDLGEIPERLLDGRLAQDKILDQFHMAYYDRIIRFAAEGDPEIVAFDGDSHERTLEKFKSHDLRRIVVAREEVALSHFAGIPTGSSGELGVIKREINKRRRHLPLRKLMASAGPAIQAIKPVFMMSPMSIAQYLPPGSIEFDLLLIDEASQVRPVDALGAISRVRQMIIVGDDKQLPPTPFFAKGYVDDEDDEDESIGDLESILGLCSSVGISDRMLRWHYRSKHHSLITVSNHEFYDNRLYVVPSPYTELRGMGVIFDKVDGVFDRGRSATNRKEAEYVANAVIEHARETPRLSLGVGTFSAKQRDAILDELEMLWRNDPEVKEFFSVGGAEPFFVKNLENIQGDERDVIFLSVGYGYDESGFFGMNFGPLSSDGGERRLNVLITRARQQCRVFSSIRADDIDLQRARGRGPAALKTFLSYAETGNIHVGIPTGRDFDSPFEEQVAKSIGELGYEVDPQVGVAGFFVDLGVIDPEKPGRYILGIECDGASYHSARWARDRDRLRQQVLEDNGWTIHRIWSTDWFQRPDDELRKVVAAIDDAKLIIDNDADWIVPEPAKAAGGDISSDPIQRKRHEPKDRPTAISGTPYHETKNVRIPWNFEPHTIPREAMAEIVVMVADREGPIHELELARRVTTLWGLSRTGNRIIEAVQKGVALAKKQKRVSQTAKFISIRGKRCDIVRNREVTDSPTLRRPEMLPPEELELAASLVTKANVGIDQQEAAKEISVLLGFKSMSAQLQRTIDKSIKKAISKGLLKKDGEKLRIGENTVPPSSEDAEPNLL